MFLPQIMCGLLFYDLNNIAYAVCCIVPNKQMNMVIVSVFRNISSNACFSLMYIV